MNDSEEEGESSEWSVIAWDYSVLTLLDCIGQRGFKYNDITAARKICTAVSNITVHKNK
jgi:hypothetical protein